MEETVTVSGQSPTVDVSSNSKAQVLSREMLDAVPTSHTIQGVGQLVVGVTLTAPDVGGSQAMQQTYFTVHGLGAAQTSLMMDGMIINGLQGDGAIQTYTNDAGNQEMVYQTGGGTVDSPTGGVKINMIPREGGNRVSGSLFQGYESSNLQANNLTPFLAANGVKTVDKIGTYNDTNATFGGPIMKDKLWYFGSVRFFIVNKPIANTYVSDGTQTGSDQHPGVRERAGRSRRHAVPAGHRPAAPVQRPRPPHVAAQPEEQAVGLLRSHPQDSRRGDGAWRRRDDLVGAVELAALHDQRDQVHLDGHEQVAGRRRLLEQHRALQQPVRSRHRAAVRHRRVVRERASRGRHHGFEQHRGGRPSTAAIPTGTTCRRRRPTSPARRRSRSASRIPGVRTTSRCARTPTSTRTT